jgi:transposase-like protein
MQEIKTLLDAVKYFANLDACFEYMLGIKWPDGKPICPKCGSDKVGIIQSRHMLQCKNPDCRKQFSVKVETIFEDSPLGLDKWFVAVWCIANDKNGISSCELARAIGVTQKSAWHMLHRIRTAMFTSQLLKLTSGGGRDSLKKETALRPNMGATPYRGFKKGQTGEC